MTAVPIAPTPAPFHIHGHSARIGVRLAMLAMGMSPPSNEHVDQVVRSAPKHITVDEFAIEVLMTASQARAERRRSVALSILIPLIQRSVDGNSEMPEKNLHKAVELAWSAARIFEEQDNAVATLDTLDSAQA